MQIHSLRDTPLGVRIVGEPTLDDWCAVLRRAGHDLRGGTLWRIADAVHAITSKKYGETYDLAARLTGLKPALLRDLNSVVKAFPISRRHDLSPWHHAVVRKLKAVQQEQLLVRAVAEGLTRQALRDLARAVDKQTQPFPKRKHTVIYADPPWDVTEVPYPTMPTEDICKLPVAGIAADDALLYMWVTNKHLPDAFLVLTAWGFEYVTNMVWVKDVPGRGVWARMKHELLLIAKKGSPRVDRDQCWPESVITAKRRDNSRKPDELYELIEKLYPEVPKIELFARTARPGWERWGNERLNDEEAA